MNKQKNYKKNGKQKQGNYGHLAITEYYAEILQKKKMLINFYQIDTRHQTNHT